MLDYSMKNSQPRRPEVTKDMSNRTLKRICKSVKISVICVICVLSFESSWQNSGNT